MRYKFAFNVQERDIDLLLLGQLHVSAQFVTWLAEQAGVPGAEFDAAFHSVVSDRGETDLLLFVRCKDERIAIMVEDKIGAAMQPRQCERYHERGKALCRDGHAVRYYTLLCAPRAYIASVPATEPWDGRVSFEEIADWLTKQQAPAHNWHTAVLMAASSKLGRARWADDRANRAIDESLLELKKAYREQIGILYPSLTASIQNGRDREYYLLGKGLPPGIRFKHSFFRGHVILILERRWVEAGVVWFTEHLPPEGSIERHGGEMHLVVPTECFDPDLPLDAQQDTFRDALERILMLKALAENFLATSSIC